MTFRELATVLNSFMADNPGHESLDRQVVVRVGVNNGPDDEDIYVGGLQSAVVDSGFELVIDADQESVPEDNV